ncbi:MAG: NAD(P)/FAD-dependent oxidoreductase [Desulfotomaculaceae bacterium]|nr:NAD(P)/FAD-dependent oxidoreductase [Desulfotomaculaceae bacterium]MDD4767237.1 NAD(P)/FAD-dependent oxidoreductase [Desulfotomaculaceae bacterium]
MKYDVFIAGGGPAGCRTAEFIAGSGYKVLVAEEHRHIGEPMQCAGLVSPRTLKTAGIQRDIVLNEIHGAFVHSPGGEKLVFRGKKAYGLVIDRPAFDCCLAEKARESGAEILTGVRLEVQGCGSEKVNVVLKSRKKEIPAAARLLIGADGANSQAARFIGVRRWAEVIRMYAVEAELKCRDKDMAHILLGRDTAPGWFGWVIPVSPDHARAGIGVSGTDGRPAYYFKKLVESYPDIFQGMKVIRHTGGVVPVGIPPRIYGDKIMLVGDAACQTKPISGGGLFLGLLGAELCSRVASEALSRESFSLEDISVYQHLWEKKMGKEIKNALWHRNIFLTMTDKEMDTLVRFLNRPLWKYTIAVYGDIDYPSRLSGRLSFAGPWMEKFVRARFKKVLNYALPAEY